MSLTAAIDQPANTPYMLSIVIFQHVAVSSGMRDDDFLKLKAIIEAVPELTFICLDVANGYSEHFVAYVKKVREHFPEHTILVGLLSLLITQYYIFALL